MTPEEWATLRDKLKWWINASAEVEWNEHRIHADVSALIDEAMAEARREFDHERSLLLEVVKHAEALIDNEANTTAQAYAICSSLTNSLATKAGIKAIRMVLSRTARRD